MQNKKISEKHLLSSIKNMKYIPIVILIFTFVTTNAQTKTVEERPFVNKSVLIIMSTKNYIAAKEIATQAAKKLKIKLDLRALKPNKENGLTFNAKECEENGWDYPCYVSRGRYDDGEFVTIDYSDWFAGFAKGYYIVSTASGNKKEVKIAFEKVKKIYKSAYVKQAEIYIGCTH
jgi:hypothetical protein